MFHLFRRLPGMLLFAASLGAAELNPVPAELQSTVARGQILFAANCAMCHQLTGRGTPGTYPPLAASDWLQPNRKLAIRAVVAGLKDPITVNGVRYHGQMPPALLTDPQVADVLTFVLNSWGNPGGRVIAPEVAAVRAKSDFPTFEALKRASDFRPLPPAPAGFTVAETARLPDFATRLTSDRQGKNLFVLGLNGSVWRLNLTTRKFKQLLWPTNYSDLRPGDFSTLGIALDAQNQLWISFNQRVASRPLVTNEVGILRTSAKDSEGDPVAPKLWFRTRYPQGIGPYNHGVSDLRFGPDGRLYLTSGSRTDGGEPGTDPQLGQMGETDLTAAVWRFDPQAREPQLEVIARGLRNAYSLNWDGAGNLFTVANGPDAHAGEEMDHILPPKAGEAPRHHGFPYQLGRIAAGHAWYAHTPAAPAGLQFVLPVENLGPDALAEGQPTATFTPHSSPAGLEWLDATWPEAVRDGFLMGRFGNLIQTSDGTDCGFDVLSVKLERTANGGWQARTKTFLAPLGRPLDLHVAGGKIYVLEYTRPTRFKDQPGWLPGRILEVTPLAPAARAP
jgi:glucose/arabinose dehydrogenase/mono/diheme cytochrome c family protein